MRRDELKSLNEDKDFEFIASNAHIGYLGLVDGRGYPRIVPLNFAHIGKEIGFHGAKNGEKFELLQKKPKATFSIDVPYSYIPSYYTSTKFACPASHFFKSIHIRGIGTPIVNLSEKAKFLEAMMKKYQPEGKYITIEANERYSAKLEGVAVFKLIPEEITYKIKFGQNESDFAVNKIIAGLEERGDPIDLKTIEEIKRLRP